MHNLVLHTTEPREQLKQQAAAMSWTYAADLHRFGFSNMVPTNRLLKMYQQGLAWEVMSYLDRIGVVPEASVELITAHDVGGLFLGYVLYLPVPTHLDACGVTYMVVERRYRRQSIAKQMIELIRARYPHIELMCTPANVPFYQSIGFNILGFESGQIVMNMRNYSCVGQIAIAKCDLFYNGDGANEIVSKLIEEHSVKVEYAENNRLKNILLNYIVVLNRFTKPTAVTEAQ